jgi:hypothetical protein
LLQTWPFVAWMVTDAWPQRKLTSISMQHSWQAQFDRIVVSLKMHRSSP